MDNNTEKTSKTMEEKKEETKKKYEKVYLGILIACGLFFALGVTLIAINQDFLIAGIIIMIIIMPVFLVAAVLLVGPVMAKEMALVFDKKHQTTNHLHLYASKNPKYYFKLTRKTADMKRATSCYFTDELNSYQRRCEIYDVTKINEVFGDDFIVKDRRKCYDDEFMEIKVDDSVVYVCINMKAKLFIALVLHENDIKDINNLNSTKLSLKNYVLAVDQIFDKAVRENRELVREFNEEKKFEDVFVDIKEIIYKCKE